MSDSSSSQTGQSPLWQTVELPFLHTVPFPLIHSGWSETSLTAQTTSQMLSTDSTVITAPITRPAPAMPMLFSCDLFICTSAIIEMIRPPGAMRNDRMKPTMHMTFHLCCGSAMPYLPCGGTWPYGGCGAAGGICVWVYCGVCCPPYCGAPYVWPYGCALGLFICTSAIIEMIRPPGAMRNDRMKPTMHMTFHLCCGSAMPYLPCGGTWPYGGCGAAGGICVWVYCGVCCPPYCGAPYVWPYGCALGWPYCGSA